jgi:hypothetical protein
MAPDVVKPPISRPVDGGLACGSVPHARRRLRNRRKEKQERHQRRPNSCHVRSSARRRLQWRLADPAPPR